MCIDRSFYYIGYRFSFVVEKIYLFHKRNGVYIMCIDRSFYYIGYRFSFVVEKIYLFVCFVCFQFILSGLVRISSY